MNESDSVRVVGWPTVREGQPPRIARRWCESKGSRWSVHSTLGEAGAAPVFDDDSPDGTRTLKIFAARFSAGEKDEIEYKRIEQQLALKGHDSPYLVPIYDGGKVEGRFVLLMEHAPGTELEKRLKTTRVPGAVADNEYRASPNGRSAVLSDIE